MGRTALAITLPFLLFLAFTCSIPAGDAPDEGVTSDSAVVEQSSLFLSQEDGSFIFRTNDPAYWGPSGYTLWTTPCPTQPVSTNRNVHVKKQSGNAYAGYGIVFCQHDAEDPDLGDTMLLVMINTQQQYSVGEATGSHYSAYTNPTWVQDSILAKGYGMDNLVHVTEDSGGLFSLFLNGKQVMTFRDGRLPLHSGGGQGYIAVVSPQDSFPSIPVEIVYKDN